MKIRVNIDRLVLHDQSMSRRDRLQLHEQIRLELNRRLDPRHAAAPRRRHAGSPVAVNIASAIVAQLSPQLPHGPGQPR
jgi:hypothetical protein